MSQQADLPTEFRHVTTPGGLREVIAALKDQPRYAIDTEFHRERTYYPKVALVQIAWPGELVLIDPLAVSLEPLAEIFGGPTLAVMHAPSQDFEVMEHSTGTAPENFFDTQLAAGFLGMATPSLSALHERFLKKRLPKGDRLTDWLSRPLKDSQLSYAASDVADLLELHDLLMAKLTERGRLEWVEDEFAEVREKQRPLRDPEVAWLRIKEARHLRGASMGVAQALAAWRERRAAEVDQPVRFILADLAIVGLAQKKPTSAAQLTGIRGVDDRQLKGAMAEPVLAAVAHGLANPVERPSSPRGKSTPPERRPAVTLLSAWLGQLANALDLDPTLLGTRNDIEALVRGDDDARLKQGWRHEIVGAPVDELLEGRAALAFDPEGGLVLEERSGRGLGIATDVATLKAPEI